MGKLLKIKKLNDREGKVDNKVKGEPPSREWARGEIDRIKGSTGARSDLGSGGPVQGNDRPCSPSRLRKGHPLELSGDSRGNPSERYYWSHFGRVMSERRTEIGYPYPNPLEPSFKEVIDNETITKKELYP